MLIPHTRAVTSLKHWKPGTPVNLELDLVARYLVNYLESAAEPAASAKDARFALALERAGFK
jgi:riboflavin synthase